jgi:parallel beta-helix repeat protein
MRLARLCVIASVLTLTVVAVPPAAHATTGTLTITRNTTLSENHIGPVVIAANDVTLDCRNYSINGLPGMPRGLTLNYLRGVTVNNCTIVGAFGYGIYTVSDSNNQFLSNWISVSAGLGCRFNGSTQNRFESNILQGNGYGGCMLVASSGNTFTYNKFNYNTTYGVYFESSNDNHLTANEVSVNSTDGVHVRNSHGNALINNTVTYNTQNGIKIEKANNNLVAINYACANKGLDANLLSGTGNRFHQNTFCRKSPNIP